MILEELQESIEKPFVYDLDSLLKRIKDLSEEERNNRKYSLFRFKEIQGFTAKAAKIDGQWYPLSQMRKIERNVYLSNWFINKRERS